MYISGIALEVSVNSIYSYKGKKYNALKLVIGTTIASDRVLVKNIETNEETQVALGVFTNDFKLVEKKDGPTFSL